MQGTTTLTIHYILFSKYLIIGVLDTMFFTAHLITYAATPPD